MNGLGRALDNVFSERLWRSVKYEEAISRTTGSWRTHGAVCDVTPGSITRSGLISRWTIALRPVFFRQDKAMRYWLNHEPRAWWVSQRALAQSTQKLF